MRLATLFLTLLPGAALAQQAGWGNVGQAAEEKGFSWTDPLWPDFWMAWTPATLTLFIGIFAAIAVIGVIEVIWFRDGIERNGILGLTTTLGDRLFITLLGSAFIFLGYLGLVGQPVWTPLFLSIGWGVFVFWKV
jgi:predicted small integral membrane protein